MLFEPGRKWEGTAVAHDTAGPLRLSSHAPSDVRFADAQRQDRRSI
jgi:hypothetical protein